LTYINTEKEISNKEWQTIVDNFGLREKLRKAKTIVIKPNFSAGTYVDPKTHVISDINLLRSSIIFMALKNPETVIYIAEADSTGYGFAFLKFEHLELPQSLNLPSDVLKRVKILDLTRDRLQRCENKKFRRYISIDKQLWLSEKLLNSGFILNLSNLKTHAVTGYTGACKNLFGCLPDSEKYHSHPFIHEVIHDLVLAIKPDLNLVDAFYGMEKNGPVQGIDVNSGYRIFSTDPVEADIYSSTTIGCPPDKVKYIRLLCKDYGFRIETNAKLYKKYKKPGTFLRVMNRTGLFIQKCGLGIETFGHNIHSCTTPIELGITIARPVLLKMFEYEKLKAWKRKILK
jgi:uncharacterized protein (DUF362 family)